MYMCLCKGLRESDIKRLIRTLAQAEVLAEEVLEEDALAAVLGLDDDDACGQCARDMDRFLALAADAWARVDPASAA
ncbi:MAG TPA: hypothetical protein VNL15_04550 [Dehalococcoidia bacterium]|nr:hypothetical protein [Dehalococcoidia bacterium]